MQDTTNVGLNEKYGLDKFTARKNKINMLKHNAQAAMLLMLACTLNSCAFMSSAFNYKAKSPIFLAINRSEAGSMSYLLDGKPVTADMRLYRSSSTTNGYVTTTISTYLPAILIRPDRQYHTLTLISSQGTKNVLLKRDYKGAVLWLDMFLTAGIGSVVDVGSNALFGYPLVDVSDVYNTQSKNIIIQSNH